MSPYVLPGLVAVLATVLLGGLLLVRLWQRDEARNIEKQWQEREHLLDCRRPMATRGEILRRRVRLSQPAALGRGRRSGPR